MSNAGNVDQETQQLYEELYRRHGKQLEAEHNGEYLAVTRDGRTILGASLREVARRANDEFGPGNFLYKVGEKAVGRWR